MDYCVGDIVKVNDGVFVDLFGSVTDTKDMVKGCYIRLIGEEDSMYFEFSEVGPANPRDYFVAIIEDAIEKETPYMFMVVKIKDYIDNELIIEPLVNFEDKLEYVLETYDEQLNHKYSKGIEIVGFGVSENLKEIEEKVYGECECDSTEDELQEPQKENTIPVFRVGDRVKVVKAIPDEGETKLPNGVVDFIGRIGVIASIDENLDNLYPVIVRFGEYETMPLKQEEIERCFEVGDKVLINSGFYFEKVGRVVENRIGSTFDNVVEIGDIKFGFNNNELELLIQVNEEEFNKLPIGTKVYVEYNMEKWSIKVKNGIETITQERKLEDEEHEFIGDPINCMRKKEIKVYRF